MPLALLLQLASACAPSVAPETMAAIARTESGFEALAIGDNSTGRSYLPASLDDAIALATGLRTQGHSIDLGLMQINSANLAGLGLSIGDAFDACRSLGAGSRILVDAFSGGATPDEAQAALRVALSRYNTGNAQRGFLNGYVHRVEASAQYLVPALRLANDPVGVPLSPALPAGIRARAPVPSEADGEWHAGRSFSQASAETTGEWHAAGVDEPHPAPSRSSTSPSPDPVVVLQAKEGSK